MVNLGIILTQIRFERCESWHEEGGFKVTIDGGIDKHSLLYTFSLINNNPSNMELQARLLDKVNRAKASVALPLSTKRLTDR